MWHFRPGCGENQFFCPPAGKRQLPGRCAKRSCRFPAPSSRKIVYWPWPVKQKASDHMFVNLGFASADNYMWSETFLILLAMGGGKKLGQSIYRVNCHPSRRQGWQTRDVSWPILLPWSVYYFSSYPGRKYHIRVLEPGAKVVLSQHGVKRATPEHIFATLAFGSGGNLHVDWTNSLPPLLCNILFWELGVAYY